MFHVGSSAIYYYNEGVQSTVGCSFAFGEHLNGSNFYVGGLDIDSSHSTKDSEKRNHIRGSIFLKSASVQTWKLCYEL